MDQNQSRKAEVCLAVLRQVVENSGRLLACPPAFLLDKLGLNPENQPYFLQAKPPITRAEVEKLFADLGTLDEVEALEMLAEMSPRNRKQ